MASSSPSAQSSQPHHYQQQQSPVIVKKCVLFGAGTVGFAIAKLFSDNRADIPFVVIDPNVECVNSINNKHQHPYFHKGAKLAPHVTATTDIEAVIGANMIILCVPGQFLRACVRDFAPLVENDIIVLNVAKALEKGTNQFMHVVVQEEWRKAENTKGHRYQLYFAALAGGMIAEEVTRGWPVAADIACENLLVAKHLRDTYTCSVFKLRVTDDVIGVELAGAFKNVLAIGAGFFDGLGIALSSKAAFISEGSREMRDLAIMMGARPETFGLGSHAWLGDLITTCFGVGRNRLFGEMIGSGMKVSEAIEKLEATRKRAEGYLTTKAFYNLAKARGINTPFLRTLTEVLFEDKPPKLAVEDFFRGTDFEHLQHHQQHGAKL